VWCPAMWQLQDVMARLEGVEAEQRAELALSKRLKHLAVLIGGGGD